MTVEHAFRQYRKRLTNYAHRRTHNYADAEDIAQEALIRLWQAGELEDAKPWLYRVTARLCVDRLRQAQSLARYVVVEVAIEDVAMYIPAPDTIAPVEMRIEAEEVLAPFSEEHRRCLMLQAVGWRSAEIAEELGISPQTVRRYQMEVRRAANGLTTDGKPRQRGWTKRTA